MRILIAEDDAGSRLILEATVAQLGHEFVSAADGEEAWRLFENGDIDAVISDRSMPRMNGIDLCRRVRAARTSRYPYFIFLTSAGDKPRISDGMNAGADDYLTKPLDPDELAARLVVAARISALQHQLATQQCELQSLNQRLYDQARIDPLTQLASRLKLSEDLDLIETKLEHYRGRYCAVMCDLDYFKRYNDAYGHLAGDEVLRAVAQALRNNFRSEDLAYRYGGEEFLLILRATSATDGHAAAERHRNAVRALRIPHRESPFKIVTMTMGIAPLAGGLKVTSWLEEADAALYEAKRLGRNQVFVSKDKVMPD